MNSAGTHRIRPSSACAAWGLLCTGAVLMLSGCPDWYVADADREVYRLIRETRQSLGGEPEAFTIDRPEVQPTILDELARRQGIGPDGGNPTTRPATRPATDAATRPASRPADEGAIELTLQDALRQAFLYSRDYQEQKEGLYLQALSLTLEYHLWTPQFVATFTAEMQRSGTRPDVSRIFQHTGTLGATQRLPYGGSVTARVLYTLIEDLREDVTEPPLGTEDDRSGAIELSAELPLLRGAGTVAQEDLIQAKRELIYQVRSFERFRREYCVRIASRYFNLLQQSRQVVNRRMSWESLKALARRTQALFELNFKNINKLDVQRAQQDAFAAENNYIDAMESYELALDEFKILLSLPTTARVRLSHDVPGIAEPPLSMTRGYRLALKRRLDLMNAHGRRDDAVRRVRVARNDLLADLNLTASATVSSGENRTFGRYEFDEPELRVGIELGLPVNRVSQRNAYRRSLIELSRQRRTVEQFEDQVKLQVRSAIRRARQASQAIKIQQQAIDLAEKRLRFATLQLNEGKISNRDVVEAEEALLGARNRYESALNSYRTAILEYLRDVGVLKVGPNGRWR